MTITTKTKAYGSILNGNLTFSNIAATEIDTVNGSSALASFISGAGDVHPITLGSEIGIGWSAFQMAVLSDGTGASQTLNISYDIAASGSQFITSIDSIYQMDQVVGDGRFTAVERIFDSNNTLLATQTFVSGSPAPAPAQLSIGVQSAHVVVSVVETATSANSLISASILAGLFGQAASSELATLGDYVWFDANQNGLRDSGETGVAGVTVDLLNAAGTSTIAFTTTNASGAYLFNGVLPGAYEVKFINPMGLSFTTQTVGTNTAIDSDANATTGITAPITLTAGQTNLTIDAGLISPAQQRSGAIGDYVWFDTNGDGVQNSGETGVAGVTVDLLNAAGTSTLAVTTTNASGAYLFTGLAAGTYEVQFIAPAADTFTTQTVGTNTGIDSNANGTTGITAPITLTAGQTDLTIDAGLVAQGLASITIDKTVSSAAVVSGGSVSYSYLITNTGTQTLTGIQLNDIQNGRQTPGFPVSNASNPSAIPASLAPGASFTYTTVSAPAAIPALPAVSLSGGASAGTAAGFSLGDAANYAMIAFAPHNFQTTSDSPIAGNVGIGPYSGVKLAGGQIVGNLVTTGTAPSGTGGTVTGSITGNNAQLAADITNLQALSAALASETGRSIALSGGSTVNANAGVLDASGNEVFTITSWSTGITINGDGTHAVVLNFANGVTPKLNGSITLTGGITSNEVLFNYTGTGALQGAGNGADVYGTFLVPNAKVNVDSVNLHGHLFGGAAGQDFQWVSNAFFEGAPPSGVTNIGTVTAAAGSTSVTASDSAHVVVTQPGSQIQIGGTAPTAGTNLVTYYELMPSNNKSHAVPAELEFQFNPGGTVATQFQGNGTGLAKIGAASLGVPAGPSFIVVSNNVNAAAAGAVEYFEGLVAPGQKFFADATSTIAGVPTGGTFASTLGSAGLLYANIFNSQADYLAGAPARQQVQFQANGGTISSSVGIALGDTIGSLKVVGYISDSNQGYVV